MLYNVLIVLTISAFHIHYNTSLANQLLIIPKNFTEQCPGTDNIYVSAKSENITIPYIFSNGTYMQVKNDLCTQIIKHFPSFKIWNK